MPRNKTSSITGLILQKLHTERDRIGDKSIEALWSRSGLSAQESREGYYIETTKTSNDSGQEIVEHVLWKAVDAIRTVTEVEVNTTVELGLEGTKAEKSHARE